MRGGLCVGAWRGWAVRGGVDAGDKATSRYVLGLRGLERTKLLEVPTKEALREASRLYRGVCHYF